MSYYWSENKAVFKALIETNDVFYTLRENMLNQIWVKGEYTISNDKAKLQIEMIHNFLSKTYWANEISLERVKIAIKNSLCFGLYHNDKQIGFARCVTDFATFGYLGDVFILSEYQKLNLGKWLIDTIFSIKELQLRRWCLATSDAHGLYKKFGFSPLEKPELFMEKFNPNFYKQVVKKDQRNPSVSIEKVEKTEEEVSSTTSPKSIISKL